MGYLKATRPTAKEVETRRIGVVPYQGSGVNLFESEFHQRIFRALEKECQKRQIEIVLEFHRNGEIPLCVKNRTVDAVCLLGRYSQESIQFAQHIPTLAVSSFASGAKVPRVVADNLAGMAEMTDHLVGLGHRRILFISPKGEPLTGMYRDRLDGYSLAMARHGLRSEVCYVGEQVRPLPVDLAALEGFTAVLCADDADALGLLDLLEGKGIEVPGGLSLAGFDDISDAAQRGLTTYAPDWEAMGRHAAHLLSFRPQEQLCSEFKLVVPGRLISRRTVAAV